MRRVLEGQREAVDKLPRNLRKKDEGALLLPHRLLWKTIRTGMEQ